MTPRLDSPNAGSQRSLSRRYPAREMGKNGSYGNVEHTRSIPLRSPQGDRATTFAITTFFNSITRVHNVCKDIGGGSSLSGIQINFVRTFGGVFKRQSDYLPFIFPSEQRSNSGSGNRQIW